MDDTLDLRAKQINLRYSHLYNGTEETPENMEKEWSSLDSFTRYSNISAADYHKIRLDVMAQQCLPQSADDLSPADLEQLSELEHIRWCRYHYLNNWKQGTPVNNRVKDPVHRTHSLLRPYDTLPESEKEKNRESIRILLSLS